MIQTSGKSPGKVHLYEKIAEETAQNLKRGLIPPGEKLPSLRSMSLRYGCSVSVVSQAYAELEIQGCIRSVEKSGFFALAAPSNLPQPQDASYPLSSEEIRPLSTVSRIVREANDPDVVPLGCGIPDSRLLPVAALKRSLFQTGPEAPELFGLYSSELGHSLLREHIASLMRARDVPAGPEDILITNGCTEAVSLAVSTVSRPGDAVAVESPAYPGILQILKESHRRIVPIPTSVTTGPDLNALERVLHSGTASTVLLSPIHQNPLGFVMPVELRKQAVELVRRYNAVLIEDDTYGECSFSRERHRPAKAFDDAGDVIYCSSFSKTLSPGMRMGWLMGGKHHGKAATLKTTRGLGSSPIIQDALARFLSGGAYHRHLRELRKALSAQAAEIKTLLLEHLPAGTAVSNPQGGLYFWVELPAGTDGMRLYREALAQNVGIVPGQAFASGNRYPNCIRISFGAPVTERTRQGVAILGRLCRGSD